MDITAENAILNLQNTMQNGFFFRISCVYRKKVVTLQPKVAKINNYDHGQTCF